VADLMPVRMEVRVYTPPQITSTHLDHAVHDVKREPLAALVAKHAHWAGVVQHLHMPTTFEKKNSDYSVKGGEEYIEKTEKKLNIS